MLGKLRKSKNFYAIDFIYRVNGRSTYKRVQNFYKIPIKANSVRITKSNYTDNLNRISYIRLYGLQKWYLLEEKMVLF